LRRKPSPLGERVRVRERSSSPLGGEGKGEGDVVERNR